MKNPFAREPKKSMAELFEKVTILMLGSYLKRNQGVDEKKIDILIKDYLEDKQHINKDNFKVSSQVLERLQLRHAILKNMEQIESEYDASKKYVPRLKQIVVGCRGEIDKGAAEPPSNEEHADTSASEGEIGNRAKSNPKESNIAIDEYKIDVVSERSNRVYRLAATDLFVEKAISYLEKDAASYIVMGTGLFILALIIVCGGVVASGILMFFEIPKIRTDNIYSMILFGREIVSVNQDSWIAFARTFTKAFTFYGFIVLLAVLCIRLGKALLDQAERLRERRHSLRQGRLYIHLSNGEVTIEELEKAFDWNVSKGNAFGNIPTEASAPWGSVIKEALKAIPEAFKKAKGAKD